jgi:hypothetical protein
MTEPPIMDRAEILRTKFEQLQQEHRDLDAAIAALDRSPRPDALMLRRLKKQKLALKDRLARLTDEMTPDIIA